MLTVLLAAPRGFCAGVDRAVQAVEDALAVFGAPVYVRHQIVHNRHVTERLEALGAVFVEELDEVPDGAPTVFSAHGVPPQVHAEAQRRGLRYIDAACPLVTKVHVDIRRHAQAGRELILIGHAGHPEVIGTMGQLPPGSVHLVETVADAETLQLRGEAPPAFVTQTTLSVDDTAAIVAVLRRRFPDLVAPRKQDICYATSNRQEAVKALVSEGASAVLVIGAPNSSNSVRLVEVAERAGAAYARLISGAEDIDFAALADVKVLGLTAGASAPEILVQQTLHALAARRPMHVREIRVREEHTRFKALSPG